jgi:hypothetical protein
LQDYKITILQDNITLSIYVRKKIKQISGGAIRVG